MKITQLINPLHSTDHINRQIRNQGYYDPTRMTGNTTGVALGAISEAILNPHTSVNVHAGSSSESEYIFHITTEMIKALNLKHLTVRRQGIKVSVTFE